MMIDVPAGTLPCHEFLFRPDLEIAGGEFQEVPVEDRGVQRHIRLPRLRDIERERDIGSLVENANILAEETERWKDCRSAASRLASRGRRRCRSIRAIPSAIPHTSRPCPSTMPPRSLKSPLTTCSPALGAWLGLRGGVRAPAVAGSRWRGHSSPERLLVLRVPLPVGGLHRGHAIRLLPGEVLGFADILDQVVECERLAAVLHEFPIALSNGPSKLRGLCRRETETPVERVVRRPRLLAGEEGQQIGAVELPAGLRLHPGRGQRGGQDVETDHRLVVGLARAGCGPSTGP